MNRFNYILLYWTLMAVLFISNDLVGQCVEHGSSPQELRFALMVKDAKHSYKDLLELARQLLDDSPNDAKSTMKSYVNLLERMQKSDKQKTEKNEIRKNIYSLRNQRNFSLSGTYEDDCPASTILKFGKAAVPYLIDEIDNNELTRSVIIERGFNESTLPKVYIQRTGDVSVGLLRIITGKSFAKPINIHDPENDLSPKKIKNQYKEWWEKQSQ